MTDIGALIRQERERRGLSQEQLATMVHIDRSAISRIETGSQLVTHDILERLIEALKSPKLRLEILGGVIPCIYLNNVDYHPLAVQQTAIKEMREAIDELEKLNLINKIGPEDLTEEEQENLLHKTMMELQDVNICMDLILMALSERYNIDLKELDKLSREKMRDKGHLVEAVG